MVADGRARGGTDRGSVRVWDAVVRSIHAALAALVFVDWILDDGGPLHRAIGYGAALLVLARLAWAAVARGEGAWRGLVPSIPATREYLRQGAPRSLGHDPLGRWMVWLLWTLVLLLALTGWVARLDAFWGDETIRAVHATLADVLMLAVVLHVAGVAAMSWLWRENLAASMVTGRKRAPVGDCEAGNESREDAGP